MSTDRVLLAVDGNSLVHRAFHAHAATGARSRDGRGIWAVRGLLGQLVAAVERIGPDAVVVGFDDPDRSIRRDTWPQYKARRAEKLDSLVEQIALAVEILREMGIAVVVPEALEADDVLASAARFAAGAGARTVIMTSDRDAFSLIDASTRVLRIINGGVEASPLLTPERLVLMLGIRPEQYRDYAALRGDTSDNLPGVTGIGPKTAARLLAELGSAAAAFDDIAAGGHRVSAAVGAGGDPTPGPPRRARRLGTQLPGDGDAHRSRSRAAPRRRPRLPAARTARAAAGVRAPPTRVDDHRRASRPGRRHGTTAPSPAAERR